MFDKFFKKPDHPEKSPLTSLDLETPVPPPKTEAPANASTKAVTKCSVLHFRDEAHKAAVFADQTKQYREWTARGQRPISLYFGVLPQQGLPMSSCSVDGKLTTLYFFDTPFAAKYAFERLRPTPAIAGCTVGSVPAKGEKWIAAGINSFAMIPCRLCGPRNVFRAENLLSHDKFTQCLGVEIVQRAFRTRGLALQTQAQLAKNKAVARASLEYLRDHFDAGNPYVHWMIAILAGMEGDMKANADSIAQMEELGPEFAEKLRGKPFDASPESQFLTFPEAMMGILLSYKCLDMEKLANKPPTPPAAS
jgi:hypothetical protein